MADLILTVDDNGEEAPENSEGESDDNGGGLVMPKKFSFDDMKSDDEDDDEETRKGWDFVPDQDVVGGENRVGLQARIKRQKAKKKRELEGKDSDDEEDDEEDEDVAEDTAKGDYTREMKVKKRMKVEQEVVDTSHLRTGMHFADLRLSRPLLRAVSELNFTSPTPIQRDVIPPALRGLDVLATAETGSGKTAAFLLPVLERLCQSPNVRVRRRDSQGRILTGAVATKAMILIPTRELAVQCKAMLTDLAKHTYVTHQLVAGGFESRNQAQNLRSQPDIVVATPGRLLDHLLNSPAVHMELLEIVIFDEGDRLLELGFKDECVQVLKRCSKGRQTMLFSATLSDTVENLAALALAKPVRVHVNNPNKVAQTLQQEFVKAPSQETREAVLLSLCERNFTSSVIIFCATKKATHRIALILGLAGFSFAELHGNLKQIERVEALQRFQDGEADFLVATDLAARGLDLQNVKAVINFHIPLDAARYVHRVGRAGRMGRAGTAATIYTPDEYSKVKKLGKQCCTQVKSTVLKRTVAPDAVKDWVKKIETFESDITAIEAEEAADKEMDKAQMFASVTDNLEKYKDEIRARGEKQWHMTTREKEQQKEKERERLQELAKADEEEEARAAKGEKEEKKKPWENITISEKQRLKLKEEMRKKREKEKKERKEEFEMCRKSALGAKRKDKERTNAIKNGEKVRTGKGKKRKR